MRVASESIDTVTTAPLVDITGAVKVTVELAYLRGRRSRAAPTFAMVLCAAEGKTLVCTCLETLVGSVVVGAVQLLF